MRQAIFAGFLLAVAVTGTAGFDFWNDLRVTWGPIPEIGYDRLPRSTVDAVKDGWVPRSADCLNDGAFNGHRYTHPSDAGIALLYDEFGFVGGIQSLVPQSDLDVVGSTFRFDLVPMYQNHTIDGVTYYVVTVYFQPPAKLCSNETTGDGNIGPSSLVYFQNGPSPSQLKVAYKTRTDAILNGWTINNCVPGMGWHNFYDVEHYEDSDCNEIQPTCLLFNERDELFGFCLTYPGNSTESTRWEHPNSLAIQAVLGNAPQCLLDQVDLLGATTVHVYFTNTPWREGC